MKEQTSAIALCHPNGQLLAASAGFAGGSLADFAARVDCPSLAEQFNRFLTLGSSEEQVELRANGRVRSLSLRRLECGAEAPCVLIELGGFPASGSEQSSLIEIGRLTARLVHDYKNQMGGLKLYATFLKKKFADQPEGVEIAEKIIQGLNLMAEQANLITRLTRPVTLRCEAADPAAVVRGSMAESQARASARGVELDLDLPADLPAIEVDQAQLRGGLGTIIMRAIEAAPEGGRVGVTLAREGKELLLSVSDDGATPAPAQLAAFFDVIGEIRLNKTALDLAFARRIINEHGGRVEALAVAPSGTCVRVWLPISHAIQKASENC